MKLRFNVRYFYALLGSTVGMLSYLKYLPEDVGFFVLMSFIFTYLGENT